MDIAPLISAFFVFSLGVFVVSRKNKTKLNILFFLFCLANSIWLFGTYRMFTAKSDAEAIRWDRFIYIGVVFIPIFMHHYSIAFTGIKNQAKMLRVGYLLALTFLILSRTDYFLKGLFRYKWGCHTIAQPLHHIFLLVFWGYVVLLNFNVFKYYKTTKNAIEKNRAKYVLLAFFLLFTIGAFAYLPAYKIAIFPFSFLSGVFFAVTLGYAIVAYRLMDINVLITRGIAYSGITAIIAGAYIGLVVGLDRAFAGVAGYNPTLVHSLLFVMVLFALIYVLPQMKIRAIEMTRRALFRGKYDYQQELSEATRVIPTMLNLGQLGDYILTKIRDTMLVNKLALFVYDEAKHIYQGSSCLGLDKNEAVRIKIGENSALAGLLRNADEPLVKEELKRTGTVPEETMELAVKQLDALDAELCIPLMLKDDLTGMLTLGNKKSGEMFTEEDLSLLTALANQVALTVQYIKAIDKISSEKRYVGLGKATMRMAHDIKNPLVPVKTFLQILPDKYPKEFKEMSKIDTEFTGRFYESALEGVDRINLLVERALHYSRHPQPQFSQPDLAKLLDDVLIQEEVNLKKANVQLDKQYQPSVNSIEADSEQLMELFSNLIANSIDAMEEAQIRKLSIKAQVLYDRVAVEITDSGSGIPKDKISTIFDPFITYKHKGLGLGLAIVKKIVDEHKGSIEVSSEPGKGTKFRVFLPRKQ